MPNWAVTNIRFSSNTTPESVNAVMDLYNRIRKVQDITFDYIITPNMKSYYKSRQNCEITLYSLHTLGFGIDFHNVYRGNIVNISPIYYHDNSIDFQIVTHDAWESNVDMFLNIASQFYNNLIKVEFVTGLSDYEEVGEYITNSNEFVGRSNVKLYLEGLDNVLKYKELWDYSNPLFPSLIDATGIDNANGYWCSLEKRNLNGRLESTFTGNYIPPCLSYEGNLNYNDVKEIPDSIISIYEECRQSTDYNPELFCDINTVEYVDPSNRFDIWVDIEPIYDNFTTFLGGDSNE
jgi:hypothetical protein